jgi:hypothetical protein
MTEQALSRLPEITLFQHEFRASPSRFRQPDGSRTATCDTSTRRVADDS